MEMILAFTALGVLLVLGMGALGTAIGFGILGGKFLEGSARHVSYTLLTLPTNTYVLISVVDVTCKQVYSS